MQNIVIEPSDKRHSISISNPISMNDISVNNKRRKRFPRGKKQPFLSSVNRRNIQPPSEDEISVVSSVNSIDSISSAEQPMVHNNMPLPAPLHYPDGDDNSEFSSDDNMDGNAPDTNLDMLSNPTKKLNVPKDNDSDVTSVQSSVSSGPRVPMSMPPSMPSNINTSSLPQHPYRQDVPMGEEEYKRIQKEKQEYLYKLYRLEQKGIKSTKKLSMKHSIDDIKAEYENLVRNIDVESSIKFQRRVVMAMVSTLEFVNKRYDPFDLKLDGWSESVMDGVDEFDGTFERLHDKYKTKAQMAPEVELMMSLAGSAFMFHLTNSIFKSAMPNMSDILKQNPELMQNISTAMHKNADPNQSSPNDVHSMKGPSMPGGGGGGMGNMMGDMMSNMMNSMKDPDEEEKLNRMNSRSFGDSIGSMPMPSSGRFDDLGSVASSGDSDDEVKEMTIDSSKSGKKSVTLKL